jgi:hypothetical protein
MPKDPKSERHPAARAVTLAKIKAGEVEGGRPIPAKDPAAVALGRKGGQARARGLSKKKRAEIAKKAAQARWARRLTNR